MKKGILIHPDELTRQWIDRMADNGINTVGIHPVGGRRAAESLTELLDLCETSAFRSLIDYAIDEKGLEVEYEFHAAGFLVPRDLFANHPDYFRMNEQGERVNDCNFCVSNHQVLELAYSRAKEITTRLYRSSNLYYYWLDDARGKSCHCPKCRNLSASDQQLTVINHLLHAVREVCPAAKMAYLAYYDTMRIPEAVAFDDGIFLEYAPIEKSKIDGDIDLDMAAEELRMARLLLNHFGPKDAKVLEYWLDNSLFSHWEKPPKLFSANEDVIRRDIREYIGMGFSSIATFGCYLGPDYEKLYGEPDITPFTKAFAIAPSL